MILLAYAMLSSAAERCELAFESFRILPNWALISD
jgi:hypothetical protein